MLIMIAGVRVASLPKSTLCFCPPPSSQCQLCMAPGSCPIRKVPAPFTMHYCQAGLKCLQDYFGITRVGGQHLLPHKRAEFRNTLRRAQ